MNKDDLRRLRALTYSGSAGGVKLPPKALRKGGSNFASDRDFLLGGRRDLERLVDEAGLHENSHVLDFGCGPGRLAIAIARRYGYIGRYLGIDVQVPVIEWCRRFLPADFEFLLSTDRNTRYNPDGEPVTALSRVSGFDIIYSYSVFSHMGTEEVARNLNAIGAALNPGGCAWITAFVKEGVPDEQVNPSDFGGGRWQGPLHCVLFDLAHFERMVIAGGLTIERIDMFSDTDGQSAMLLRAV